MIGLFLAAGVSFVVATSAHAISKRFQVMMIGEINRKRPDDEQISYFGFTPSKWGLIFREYRRLYANGKAHVYYVVASAVSFLGLVMMAAFLLLASDGSGARPPR